MRKNKQGGLGRAGKNARTVRLSLTNISLNEQDRIKCKTSVATDTITTGCLLTLSEDPVQLSVII
jgi:hypothetical protein